MERNNSLTLAPGGGTGLPWLNQELKKTIPNLKIVLTDYYPNIPAFKHTKEQADNFEFVETPVDARYVPANLKGLRTQFLSLHHFRPKDAKKILQNAIDAKSSIAVFEVQERSLPSVLAMIFSPLSVLSYHPFYSTFQNRPNHFYLFDSYCSIVCFMGRSGILF